MAFLDMQPIIHQTRSSAERALAQQQPQGFGVHCTGGWIIFRPHPRLWKAIQKQGAGDGEMLGQLSDILDEIFAL